jgi:acyl carrier protein
MSIEKRVKEIVADQLKKDVSEITDGARFIEDLGADSLDIVELVMAMEEEFGIDFPEEEEKRIKTVKDVAEFIKAQKK